MKVITRKDLLEVLKKEGLPYSYKSLLKYEQMGILPRPENSTGFGVSNRSMRIYTEQEIQDAVSKLKEHKSQGLLDKNE